MAIAGGVRSASAGTFAEWVKRDGAGLSHVITGDRHSGAAGRWIRLEAAILQPKQWLLNEVIRPAGGRECA